MPRACHKKHIDTLIGGVKHRTRLVVSDCDPIVSFVVLKPPQFTPSARIDFETIDYTRRQVRFLDDRVVTFYAHAPMSDKQAAEALWDYLMRRAGARCDDSR